MKSFRTWHLPPRRVVLWHALSALPLTTVVAVGGYLSYHNHQLAAQMRERVEHEYEVLDRVSALFVSVQDAEIAQRDVLLTGDETYVASFEEAKQRIAERTSRLRELLAEEGAQLDRFARLQTAVTVKLDALQHAMSARRDENPGALNGSSTPLSATQSKDQVRQEAIGIVSEERSTLERFREDSRHRERRALGIGIAVAVFSIAIRLGVALLIHRLRRKGSPAAADT